MKLKPKDMILTALFSALMVVGAYVKIPFPPIAISLQTFFCVLAGLILGSRLGALSQLVYMLMGLAGFPVFTEGGGLTYIFKPSFGFILGFIVCAFIAGKVFEICKKKGFLVYLTAVLSGLAMIYIVGVPYLFLIIRFYMGKADFTFGSAISAGFLPFILKDLVMYIIAAILAKQIIPLVKKAV